MWSKIDWGGSFAVAQDFSRTLGAKGSRTLEATIEAYWPTIQEAFTRTMVPIALWLGRNDEAIRYASECVYQALPLPGIVRVFLRQEAFVRFCLANRERILACLPKPPEPAEELLSADAASLSSESASTDAVEACVVAEA